MSTRPNWSATVAADPADLRGILKRQMHRAMSSSGQLADQLLGAIETAVIAYDDPRAGGCQAAHTGSADTAAAAGHDRNPLGKGELVFCCQLRPPFLVSSAYQFEAAS
jgi:hypothetical protein